MVFSPVIAAIAETVAVVEGAAARGLSVGILYTVAIGDNFLKFSVFR
jgi:hypothetical protein